VIGWLEISSGSNFNFACGVDIWEIVLSFEFHENWLRGFRDTGVWKLHYLAGYLYHSLCCQDRIYRTGRNAFLICPVWGPIASDSLAFVTCHPHYNQKCTGPALQPVMCVPTLVGVRIGLRIVSFFRHKSTRRLLITHPVSPKNFVEICPQLFWVIMFTNKHMKVKR